MALLVGHDGWRVPVSPNNLKTWDCFTKCRKLEFPLCLLLTASTFFIMSTFHWLAEFLYGHGGHCHSGCICTDKIWELDCWIWIYTSSRLPLQPLLFIIGFLVFLENWYYTAVVDYDRFWHPLTSLRVIMALFTQLKLRAVNMNPKLRLWKDGRT